MEVRRAPPAPPPPHATPSRGLAGRELSLTPVPRGARRRALYGNEPCADITDAKQCALVLGGQGEMWGETVDASDLEQTVWPRLGAIAERLWSPREATTSADAAHARMLAFRCLLNRRGIAAAPVDNAGARTGPPGPGGCFTQ